MGQATQARFLIDPMAEAQTERVALDGRHLVRDLAGDAVTAQTPAALTAGVPAFNVSCVVAER